MMKIAIDSITAAQTFANNTGAADWTWVADASAEGFAKWVWDNCEEIDRDNYDAELRQYLESVGENPAEYNL